MGTCRGRHRSRSSLLPATTLAVAALALAGPPGGPSVAVAASLLALYARRSIRRDMILRILVAASTLGFTLSLEQFAATGWDGWGIASAKWLVSSTILGTWRLREQTKRDAASASDQRKHRAHAVQGARMSRP
jgi:hypothetical protein